MSFFYKLLLYVSMILMIAQCFCAGEFPSKFERIEDNKIRPLALVFTPPEAAPGDTVLAEAYFGGEPVDSVFWKVDLDLFTNIFGVSQVPDTIRIDSIMVPGSLVLTRNYTADLSIASVKFVVPSDIIKNSKSIPQDWTQMLLPNQRELVPPELRTLTKDTLLAYIDAVQNISNLMPSNISDSLFIEQYAQLSNVDTNVARQQLQAFSLALQFLTLKSKFYIDAYTGPYKYRSHGSFTIRYNTRFANFPFININNNPVIQWVAVFGIKKVGVPLFNPAIDHYDTAFYLYKADEPGRNDTILIDKGYTYFLSGDTGLYNGIDMRDAGYILADTIGKEFYRHAFFYQNDDPVPGASLNDLLLITNGSSSASFIPPSYTAMTHFTLWTVVDDDFFGERDRPRGSAFMELKGVLKYTDAYKKAND